MPCMSPWPNSAMPSRSHWITTSGSEYLHTSSLGALRKSWLEWTNRLRRRRGWMGRNRLCGHPPPCRPLPHIHRPGPNPFARKPQCVPHQHPATTPGALPPFAPPGHPPIQELPPAPLGAVHPADPPFSPVHSTSEPERLSPPFAPIVVQTPTPPSVPSPPISVSVIPPLPFPPLCGRMLRKARLS